MGENYTIDRDKKGRYRHSYVFMRGADVEIKLQQLRNIIVF